MKNLSLKMNLPLYLIRTGTLLDHEFKTKTDFLSGSQSKVSHGQPNGQSIFKRYFECPDYESSSQKMKIALPDMDMFQTVL